MRPMFEVLDEFGSRDNLIVSSILEIVEYIRTENIKVLIEYIFEKYSSKLQSLDHVETYDKLQIRYEQIKDGETNGFDVEMHSNASNGVDNTGNVTGNSDRFNNLAEIRNRHLAERDSEDDYFEGEGDDEYDHDAKMSENGTLHSGCVEERNGSFNTDDQDFDAKRSHEAKLSPMGPSEQQQTPIDPLSALSSIYGDEDDDDNELKCNGAAAETEPFTSHQRFDSDDGSALKKSKTVPTEAVDMFNSLPPLVPKLEQEESGAFFSSGVVKKNVQKKTMGQFQINIKPNGN